MAMTFRRFHAQQGRQRELINHLYREARDLVQRQAGSVVICREADDPQEILWIDEGISHSSAIDPGLLDQNGLVTCSFAQSLEPLDEFYHLPMSQYRIWSLEIHAPRDRPDDVLSDLSEVFSLALHDAHVVGMSLYRAVTQPEMFVAFLGLARGCTPERLAPGRDWCAMGLWRRIAIISEVAAASEVRASAVLSFAPFWVRFPPTQGRLVGGANEPALQEKEGAVPGHACGDPDADSPNPLLVK